MKKYAIIVLAVMLMGVMASGASVWASEYLTIGNTFLPNAKVGQPYNHQFSFTSGGSSAGLEWNISPSTFVPGLSFINGTISGKPTQSGNFSFTVSLRRRNTTDSTSVNVSLTVNEADGGGGGGGGNSGGDNSLPPSIRGEIQSLTVGVNSFKANQSINGGRIDNYLAVDNGTPPYKWTIVKGEIPRGLGLYACDVEGLLNTLYHETDRYLYFGDWEDVPVESGEYSFTIRVTDVYFWNVYT